MNKHLLVAGFCLLVARMGFSATNPKAGVDKDWTDDEIHAAWTSGETLPWNAAKKFPIAPLKLKNDTGINVLVDLAHQCSFAMLWGLPPRLHRSGFRSCGSQASLDAVLAESGYSRARIPYAKGLEPFAWIPNPKFNVVITYQRSLDSQKYLPAEIAALKAFVEDGGGLIIMGTRPPTADAAAGWSLNHLAKTFGASYTSQKSGSDGNSAVLELSPEWEVLEKGGNGPVRARRTFGKGRVVVLERSDVVSYDAKNDPVTVQEKKQALLAEIVKWAAQGKPPVNDAARLPQARAGGGGIYPELEQKLRGIVVYYAANQTRPLLDTVKNDLPKVADKLDNWLPSLKPLEPMYLVLSSGGGGGWAVNVRKPRENGIISLSPAGVISIFGHELAHTMGGPPNADGKIAGRSPHHNQGESHAGWFQGKVNAVFNEDLRAESNRNGNSILAREQKAGARIDLADYDAAKWGNSANWHKEWCLFQKLDDRYGPAWYPRWRWVQHTRWKDDPEHDLTWEEMVEDMSIAVGEDLFPFFIKAGTSLKKQRLESIEFQGNVMKLPVAPIEYTPAGNVRIEAIGDPQIPIPLDRPLMIASSANQDPLLPVTGYQTKTIEGWTVFINDVLLQKEDEATSRALDLLQKQLKAIVREVPAPAVARLRTVPLYFSLAYPGVRPRAEYHPAAEWLRKNGRNPAMAKGIEFTNIRIFAEETRRMPVFVLHELAHSYHDQVLGFDNAEVKAAYRRAVESKSYDAVERFFGNPAKKNTIERAYAMRDAKEYFAETTEALFGRNDFFPFNRAELEKHDPEMHRLLRRIWQCDTAGDSSVESAGKP